MVFHRYFTLVFFQVLLLWGCSNIDEMKGVFTPPFWNDYDPSSNLFVDHTSWGYLLNKHVQLKTDGTTVIAMPILVSQTDRRWKTIFKALLHFP